ncbi:MAG: PLD nuclease N-terminal domain-containing protein [Verrucomicrobiota bacterium]
MTVPLLILIPLGLAAVVLWFYAFGDCCSTELFNKPCRLAWLIVIALFPIGGAIAYLTAKRHVTRYSQPPEPGRLERLLKRGQ